MSAENVVSHRQFFHGSDEHFNVGDEIQPGSMAGVHKFANESSGHGDFVWMSPDQGKAAFFGKHVYEVEPKGLTNRYTYPTMNHPMDEDAHVSLAPVKVTRKGRSRSELGHVGFSVRWDDEQG